MLSREEELQMNNDVLIEIMKGRNNSDNIDGEDELQNDEDDEIIT